jgi:hypothetical protein
MTAKVEARPVPIQSLSRPSRIHADGWPTTG